MDSIAHVEQDFLPVVIELFSKPEALTGSGVLFTEVLIIRSVTSTLAQKFLSKGMNPGVSLFGIKIQTIQACLDGDLETPKYGRSLGSWRHPYG